MKNPGKNMMMLLLAGSILALGSCGDDEPEEFPDLAEGSYSLKIYNAQGQQVFERQGEAIGTGPDATISLSDPEFLTADSEYNKFAFLLINTSEAGDQPWRSKIQWGVQADSMPVILRQRYYSLVDDWSYEGTAGNVKIMEASDDHVKGSFRIDMQVDDASALGDANPGFRWTANPQWGERITIAGYFYSTHY
jgi:hypothetical protein